MVQSASPNVMLSLGDYQFGMDTAAYQQFRREVEYRWPAVERFGQPPAHQFVGAGGESISLDGVIYPHFRGGLGQVEAMRQMAGQGQPLRLMTSSGQSMGLWVIETISEDSAEFLAGGIARRIEFSLNLRRVPEAGASTIAIAAPDAAAAAPSGDQAARLDKLAGELSTSAATSALAHDAAAGHLRDLVVPVAQQGAEAVGALVRNKSMMDELSAAAARVSRAIATRPTIANAVNQAQQISRHAQDLLPSLQASEAVLARAVAVIDPLDFVSTEGKRALRSGLRAARAATSLARSSSIAASAIKDG